MSKYWAGRPNSRTVSTENNLDIEETAVKIQEHSHLIYPEDRELTYIFTPPNNGEPRDFSLTPITTMFIDTICLISLMGNGTDMHHFFN